MNLLLIQILLISIVSSSFSTKDGDSDDSDSDNGWIHISSLSECKLAKTSTTISTTSIIPKCQCDIDDSSSKLLSTKMETQSNKVSSKIKEKNVVSSFLSKICPCFRR